MFKLICVRGLDLGYVQVCVLGLGLGLGCVQVCVSGLGLGYVRVCYLRVVLLVLMFVFMVLVNFMFLVQ